MNEVVTMLLVAFCTYVLIQVLVGRTVTTYKRRKSRRR